MDQFFLAAGFIPGWVGAAAVVLAVSEHPPGFPAVQQLIQELMPQLLNKAGNVTEYALAYASRHSSSSSLRHRAAAAEMLALLDPATKAEGLKTLMTVVQGSATSRDGTLDHAACLEAHRLLLSGPLADAAAAAEIKKSCATLFKRSGYFAGASALTCEQLAEKLLATPIA